MEESQICPRCGNKLIGLRCKVQCSRCGYQEDCSDAGLIDYDAVERNAKRRPRPPRAEKPSDERHLTSL